MSKYISIDEKLTAFLDNEVKKDDKGNRKEVYGSQIKRLLGVV